MLTEPAHSGMLKVEQMKFSKILNQLFFFFFGPMREKEGMLFESGGHWSGKRFLVLSFSIQSRAHALNQEGSLEN